MTTYLLKFFAIWFACLFKFIAGPILGSAANYTLLEIVIVTVGGMMTSVVMVTYLGEWFRSFFGEKEKKKKFSARKRRIVKIWQRFGSVGIAAFTPLLLTPIGGTIIMLAFNVQKRKIFTYMFISGLCWSLIIGASINWILSVPFFDNILR